MNIHEGMLALESTRLPIFQLLYLLEDRQYKDTFVTVRTKRAAGRVVQISQSAVSRRVNQMTLDMLQVRSVREAVEQGLDIKAMQKIARKAVFESLASNPLLEPQVLQAEQELALAQQRERKIVTGMHEEVLRRQDDVELLSALDAWGRCRDSRGDTGIVGEGINAGVVHYFEYLLYPEKMKTHTYTEQSSVQEFIGFTDYVKDCICRPDPEDNQNISKCALLQDEEGRERLYILTKTDWLIVGFKGLKDEGVRILSVVTDYKPQKFASAVQAELDNLSADRFNKLGPDRRLVVIKESVDN